MAIDSFIPTDWISQIKQNGTAEVSIKKFDKLPEFDICYEDIIERYIIVTKSESDISGMPVESYLGTFYYNKNVEDKLKKVDGDNISQNLQGFMRILVVQKNNHSNFDVASNVWKELFPDEGEEKIRNDAKINRPLITKRVSTKFLDAEV